MATSYPALDKILRYIKKYQHPFAIVLLLGLGLLTRFWLFGHPNTAVFDEVYFGKFISAYFTHDYYFDIHPPLGKLIIAGFAWLFGYAPTQTFESIGSAYTDSTYMILRFLPSLAAAFLPITLYSLARELGLKTRTALLVGIAILLENALLAHGRFILMDSLLLLFGFAGVWAYWRWRATQLWHWIIFSAVLLGAAAGIKWTGLTFLAIVGLCEMVSYIRKANHKRLAKALVTLIIVPAVVYVSSFAIHLSLLHKSGVGDAFMTAEFQATLEGNSYAQQNLPRVSSLPSKIIELNYQMYAANARLTAGHPYGSKWYTWPLMLRPISYWLEGQAQIWLFGNPLVWWGSTAGLVALIWQFARGRLKKRPRLIALFLIGAYALNFLPFIGITRVMFLYHYFTALIWAVLATGFVLDKQSARVQAIIAATLTITFFILAPFTYGISPSAISTQLRSLLPSWQ